MNHNKTYKQEPILTQLSTKDALSSSPWHLMRILVITVFVVELGIMLLLEPLLFDMDASFGENLFEGTIDATLLSIIVFPVLYFYAFKPLMELIERYQRTENALDTANNFLEIVFASLTDGVIVVNRGEHQILSCNRMAEKLLGYSQTELLGQRIGSYLTEDDNRWVLLQNEIDSSLADGNIFRSEIKLNPRKELSYTAEITVNRVETEKDSSTLQVFVIRDISERIKSQEQLQLQTTALEAAANGIMITNASGLIEWVNPALLEMTGYSFEALIGRDADVFNSGRHPHEAFAAMRKAVEAGEIWSGELVNRRKDGSVYTENQSIAPVKNKQGVITHYISIKQDITERKKAEDRLERHNRELVMLSQLGQSVVSSLELPKIFSDVIEQVMPLVGADCLSIILRENNHLTYAATAGIAASEMEGRQVPLHDGVPGEVMQRGQMVHISAEDGRFKIETVCPCEPKSLLAVPLALGKKRLGLIQATHQKPHAFDLESIRTLTAAANWAAIAISHANQLDEIRHRLNETATLAAINQSLNETLDLDNILQLIADSVPKLVAQADGVMIHLLDEQENILMPAIWSGDIENEVSSLFFDLEEGLANEAFRAGKLMNIPDVAQSPFAQAFAPMQPPASLMIAPLQSGRFQLGTLTIQNQKKPNAFTVQDERLLLRFADSAAVAINTARLYQSEKDQRQQAEYLAQTAVALSQSLEMEDVLRTIVEQAASMVGGLETAVFLMRDQAVYRTYSSHPKNQQLPAMLKQLTNQKGLNDPPSLKQIMEKGKPLQFSERTQDKEEKMGKNGSAEPVFVALPLRTGEEISGFLMMQADEPTTFNRTTIRQLELLSSHASLAVQNSLLFNDLGVVLQKEQSTRAQLVQAQKLSAMGRMVASVAHELNNPLQTIKNCLFLIQQDIAEESPTQSYLEMSLSETNRLTNLVLQLRDVYRQASSNVHQPVDLTEVVNQVHIILREHLRQNNITYAFHPLSEKMLVSGDANQLKQVVINICLNAMDAMVPNRGQIIVSTELSMNNNEVGLAIQDNGVGITADDIEKLFEPFFTKKESGTGLGLAICYDIVQNHGGRIDVASELGKGAKFTIWLPILQELLETKQI